MAIAYLQSSLPGVESLRGVADETQWNVFHERLELVAIYSARGGIAHYRGRTIDIRAPSIAVFEPGNLHRNARNHGSTFQALILETGLVESMLPARLRPNRLHFAPICPSATEEVLALHQTTHQLIDEAAEPLALEYAIIRLLAKTIDLLGERGGAARFGEARRDDACVRRVLTRLDAEFARSVSLAELAEEGHCDKFHLLRCFKALVGVPPHQYLIQRRVSHARRLLREGESVAAAAAAVGFHDQSHLVRHFKRIVGVTPSQYAAGARGRPDARQAR